MRAQPIELTRGPGPGPAQDVMGMLGRCSFSAKSRAPATFRLSVCLSVWQFGSTAFISARHARRSKAFWSKFDIALISGELLDRPCKQARCCNPEAVILMNRQDTKTVMFNMATLVIIKTRPPPRFSARFSAPIPSAITPPIRVSDRPVSSTLLWRLLAKLIYH